MSAPVAYTEVNAPLSYAEVIAQPPPPIFAPVPPAVPLRTPPRFAQPRYIPPAVDSGALPTTSRYVTLVVYQVTLRDIAIATSRRTAAASCPVRIRPRTLRPPHPGTPDRCQMTQIAALQMTVARHLLGAARFRRCAVVLQRQNGKTSRRSSRGKNCVTHEKTKASVFSVECY